MICHRTTTRVRMTRFNSRPHRFCVSTTNLPRNFFRGTSNKGLETSIRIRRLRAIRRVHFFRTVCRHRGFKRQRTGLDPVTHQCPPTPTTLNTRLNPCPRRQAGVWPLTNNSNRVRLTRLFGRGSQLLPRTLPRRNNFSMILVFMTITSRRNAKNVRDDRNGRRFKLKTNL